MRSFGPNKRFGRAFVRPSVRSLFVRSYVRACVRAFASSFVLSQVSSFVSSFASLCFRLVVQFFDKKNLWITRYNREILTKCRKQFDITLVLHFLSLLTGFKTSYHLPNRRLAHSNSCALSGSLDCVSFVTDHVDYLFF